MKSTAWLIALLCPLCLFSQSKKFTFKLGEEYELPKHTADVAFIGNQKSRNRKSLPEKRGYEYHSIQSEIAQCGDAG